MARPVYRVVAKKKNGSGPKEFVDIGALFQATNGEGFSLVVKPGTVIKIASAWDKAAKAELPLKEPKYLNSEEYFLNVYPADSRNDAVDTRPQDVPHRYGDGQGSPF